MNNFINALRNYAGFSGRTSRKEFWSFILFNTIFSIAAAILDNVLGLTTKVDFGYGPQQLPYGYIYFAYSIFMTIPVLAITVRRLHDIGKSAWYWLIALIPFLGVLWLVALFCKKGDAGDNKYGVDPEYTDGARLFINTSDNI